MPTAGLRPVSGGPRRSPLVPLATLLFLAFVPRAWALALPPTDEDGPEAPAPPRTATGACRVACGADSCATLSPGTAPTRDDSADIIQCLNACRCVKLLPDPANGNLKFLVRQSINVGGMNNPVRLLGAAPAGSTLPLLKATGTCTPGAFIEPFTDSQGRPRMRYKPVLNFNRAPNGVLADFRIKVADYKQSCMNHTLRETYTVNITNSPGIRVEDVRVIGQTPARGADTGGGILGGIQVSTSTGAILRRNQVRDVGYAIGDDPDDCLTASGVAGLKVADSGSAIVDNNDVVDVAFGIAVVNENVPSSNNSSGSKVTNNRITGAAGLQCEILGTFSNGACSSSTAASDKKKIRCSQGRALRFAGLASNVVRNACAENNYAVQFGGREGQTNASGLDLTGYVESSRFRNNVFDGTNSHVEFNFQPRANTVNNIVQGNVFVGADTCDVNFQSQNGAQVVADQCGLTRADTGSTASPNSGNNRFTKFTGACGKGTTPPSRCTRTDVPPAPPFPAVPGGPPPVQASACTP